MMKKVKINAFSAIYRVFYPLFFELVYIKDKKRVLNEHGGFKVLKNRKKHEVLFHKGAMETNVTGHLHPEIAYMIQNLDDRIENVILDGEPLAVIRQIKKNIAKLEDSNFITVGLGSRESFHIIWDFENDPPSNIQKADLIISQAMLEHLLRPYKHVCDLSQLLNKGGHLITHTVLPGYTYHRYPIDALRFYPDWFEETANRLSLEIVEKYQYQFHIFYHFKKIN